MYTMAFLGFTDTLKNTFYVIFNEVLAPVLRVGFELLFKFAGDIFMGVFAGMFMYIYMVFLKIVDWLGAVFDIFSGYRYVLVDGEKTYLLDYLINLDGIKMSFIYITLLATALSMLFTIITVARSVSDMALEDKNPVGKILGRAVKTAFTFAIVPLIVIFALELGNITVVKISNAITGESSNATLGKIIFLSTARNAVDTVEGFNTLSEQYMNPAISFINLSQEVLEKDFNNREVDYITGYLACIVVILILIGSIFLFIRRIFDVLILYVVSPLFVSTIPLDDGSLFAKWRDMFVAKLVSGYSVVFTMKIFLSFAPTFYGSDIIFYGRNSVEDALIRVIVIIGGCWAAYKSQHTLLSIISPELANQARQSSSAMVGLAVGVATGGAGKLAGSMAAKRNMAQAAAKKANSAGSSQGGR